jgi:uncharacterized protein YhaN
MRASQGLQETSKEAGPTADKLGWGSNMRGKQESDQIMHGTEQSYGRRPRELLELEIASLQAENAGLQANAATMDLKVAGLQAENKTMELKVAGLQAENKKLSIKATTMELKVAGLQAKLAENKKLGINSVNPNGADDATRHMKESVLMQRALQKVTDVVGMVFETKKSFSEKVSKFVDVCLQYVPNSDLPTLILISDLPTCVTEKIPPMPDYGQFLCGS